MTLEEALHADVRELRDEVARLRAVETGLRGALADANAEVERLRADNERMREVLKRLSIGPVDSSFPCSRCGGPSRPTAGVEDYRSCDACMRAFPVRRP
jgi:hypothetical protein